MRMREHERHECTAPRRQIRHHVTLACIAAPPVSAGVEQHPAIARRPQRDGITLPDVEHVHFGECDSRREQRPPRDGSEACRRCDHCAPRKAAFDGDYQRYCDRTRERDRRSVGDNRDRRAGEPRGERRNGIEGAEQWTTCVGDKLRSAGDRQEERGEEQHRLKHRHHRHGHEIAQWGNEADPAEGGGHEWRRQ
jgi:hypothetical protein